MHAFGAALVSRILSSFLALGIHTTRAELSVWTRPAVISLPHYGLQRAAAHYR